MEKSQSFVLSELNLPEPIFHGGLSYAYNEVALLGASSTGDERSVKSRILTFQRSKCKGF